MTIAESEPLDGTQEPAPSVSSAMPSIRQYGTRALFILFTLNAVDEFDRAVLAVALDDIRAHFGLSDVTVALLPLAVIFITGILALPVGNWADRWTRRNILAIGAMIWGTAGLFAAASRSFVQLFFTRALLGVGLGTIGPTHLSLLSDYYPVSVRGRVLNIWRSANAFGQIVGAIIGSAIIASVGWRWGFAVAAVPGLLFGLFALATLREPKRGESDLATAVEENPLLAEFLREPDKKWGFFESLSTIFGIRTLRYLIFSNAAIGFVLLGLVYWFPALFEREYGFSTRGAGATIGALGLAAFLGTWYAGTIADRRRHYGFGHLIRMCVLAVLILLVTWSAGFAIPVPQISLVLIIGGALVASLGSGGVITVIAACSPPHIRSQSFAAFGLALAVCGAAAAPVIVGGISVLFQRQAGINEGDSLRYAILICTAVVSSLCAWFLWQASRSADDDVRRVFGDFIAQHTAQHT